MTPGIRPATRQLFSLFLPAVFGLYGCSGETELPATSDRDADRQGTTAQALGSGEASAAAGVAPRLYDPATGLPCHLANARTLVEHVDDAPFAFDDPDTNSWGSPGSIDWVSFAAVTQGASLFTLSLLHCDAALTPAVIREWWGSTSPNTVRYYQQILAGNRFTQVSNIDDIRPGDVIVINYTDRENTGHLAIIEGTPAEIAAPIRPIVSDTTQYALPIIDSTSTSHGCAIDGPTADTRWVPTDARRPCAGGSTDGGAGRGTLRLYATSRGLPGAGTITGYGWSLASGSAYYVQGGIRPHVIGRLIGSDVGEAGGGCSAPQAVCGGACVDTTSDPNNCGSCGRSCQGAPCSASQCEPIVLASDQDVSEHLDVDETSVYWTTRSWPSYLGSVMKLDKAGEALVALATGQPSPYPIVVDGSGVYWANVGSGAQEVLRVSAAGGVPALFAAGQATPTDLAKDATRLYWTNYNGGTIMAANKSGGAPVTLVVGQDYPRTLAVDDTSVYWINLGTVGAPGAAVMRASKSGGAPTAVASGTIKHYALAVDDTSVYWAEVSAGGDEAIMKASKSGGAPIELVSGAGNVYGIAVDATSVYWTDYGRGQVMKVGKSGGMPVVLADWQGHPNAIAVDESSVYWCDTGNRTVMKVAK